RSKFVHYRPRIAILNNLDYDHADIFPDRAAIQRQFHHLVRSVPAGGRLIVNAHDKALAEVLAMGAWTPVETFAADGQGVKADWRVRALNAEASHFEVLRGERSLGEVHWSLPGQHNMLNGVAAIAAAAAAGVKPALAISALFLASYLTAHYYLGSTRYRGEGALRIVYFAVLLSHTVLATLIVPLAGVTVWKAFQERFDRHKAWARWTFPIWLYVSVT
ncbi:MAG: DUF420 domain-containing protein, partial [Pseudomonadota bacterium]